jgi:hypothetical protein
VQRSSSAPPRPLSGKQGMTRATPQRRLIILDQMEWFRSFSKTRN